MSRSYGWRAIRAENNQIILLVGLRQAKDMRALSAMLYS